MDRDYPKCGALGCDNDADPRMYVHGPYGVVQVCDGCGMGGICQAGRGGKCTCPPVKPRRDPHSVWAMIDEPEAFG